MKRLGLMFTLFAFFVLGRTLAMGGYTIRDAEPWILVVCAILISVGTFLEFRGR